MYVRLAGLLLEGAEDPVEAPNVDPLVPSQLRDELQELVPMHWPLAQEEQNGRLHEPLDAGANRPAAAIAAAVPSSSHTYMFSAYRCER